MAANVSSLEVALRAETATLKLPETGSEKVCALSFPLYYTGSEAAETKSRKGPKGTAS